MFTSVWHLLQCAALQGATNLIMAADAYLVSHEEKQLSHEIDLPNQSRMDPDSSSHQ